MTITLNSFIKESLAIEGIHREPTPEEIGATRLFLDEPRITASDCEELVRTYAPHAVLRNRAGLDVVVGDHLPPRGGMEIELSLEQLLHLVVIDSSSPYVLHCEFETLHPFTDGNGRCGRAIWLWHMMHHYTHRQMLRLPFLHLWYYQSLQHFEGRKNQ